MNLRSVLEERQEKKIKGDLEDTVRHIFGNRIPRDFFITSGIGESDIAVHAGSYHLALKNAGIEGYNHLTYSSILPAIANEILQPNSYVHGSVMEGIAAVSNSEMGKRATAALIFGWLHNKETGKKYGGLVCESAGSDSEAEVRESLKASLYELYSNGYSDEFLLDQIKFISKSFIPIKKFGTAIVALCFTSYVQPVSL